MSSSLHGNDDSVDVIRRWRCLTECGNYKKQRRQQQQQQQQQLQQQSKQ
ncbi:hypothetical protein KR093_005233 [Drosophila rubida]|uniref:Uncharacterized protein n=1 Tax=Drosophila rubida TaxID=30044 RepID=A0AAD4KBG7_9MUSC|nr:hypothetical protein KR093_005233 [Drosophila rubida]